MRLLLTGDYFYDASRASEDFDRIKGQFAAFEHVVLNYEGSLEAPSRRRKAVNLAMSEASLELPDNVIFCVANNHILDFGPEGWQGTAAAMNDRAQRYYGLEQTRGASDNFFILDGEIKTCLVSFGWKNEECVEATHHHPGVVNFTNDNIERTFAQIKPLGCDRIIAYCHIGYEYEYYPLPLHVGLCRHLVDLGADLVYASHTHCLQPFEVYRGAHIFYGLGNFFFGSRASAYPPVSDEGVALDVTLSPPGESLVPQTWRVRYDRASGQTHMVKDQDYLQSHQLYISNLSDYASSYSQIRTRKKNPRPIMHYERPMRNAILYYTWLLVVKITGALRIRQVVKRIMGWG